MRVLIRQGFDNLPLPASGSTSLRWRTLAKVAALDLSLAKIFESHTDARAILTELGEAVGPGDLLAVWAAENPRSPLTFDPTTSQITGTKQWCSGANIVDECLLTARLATGEGVLVRASLRQPGITVQTSRWASAGIAAAETSPVHFDNVRANQVGGIGAYLARPGFWQGGAGIAAVWYGGASAIAATLASSPQVAKDPHCAAHLGAVYSQLHGARALLLSTAAWIDEHPLSDATIPAQSLRAVVEVAATETLQRTGRALGAAPLCMDREHAGRVADLEVFLRQSHAERDLAALGSAVGGRGGSWLW